MKVEIENRLTHLQVILNFARSLFFECDLLLIRTLTIFNKSNHICSFIVSSKNLVILRRVQKFKGVLKVIRGGSRAATTSKMERFVIIVNGCKSLTIITKRSILDVVAVLDPPLVIIQNFH